MKQSQDRHRTISRVIATTDACIVEVDPSSGDVQGRTVVLYGHYDIIQSARKLKKMGYENVIVKTVSHRCYRCTMSLEDFFHHSNTTEI